MSAAPRRSKPAPDWRPGFAKRAPNYAAVRAAAEAWRWQAGVNVGRIRSAVTKGTPMLSKAQRLTLLIYVDALNDDDLEESIACVWPSTAKVAAWLDDSPATVRKNRAALEAAGFMIRAYTVTNHVAGVEAYDLAPLAARLEELEAAAAAASAAVDERRARNYELDEWGAEAGGAPAGSAETSGGVRENAHLEQSPENLFSVGEDADAPDGAKSVEEARRARRAAGGRSADASPRPRPAAARAGAIRSPRRASGGAEAAHPSVRAAMVRQELQAAVQACPRLAPMVPNHVLEDPASASLRDCAAIAAAAQALLPEAARHSELTVEWGWRRHGPRVIAMLAIALTDPGVQNPCKYFGWMATRDPEGAPDLRLNLARILRRQAALAEQAPQWAAFEDGLEAELEQADPQPPPAAASSPAARAAAALMDAPGAGDPRWQAIDAQLRRLVKAGPYGSWFARLGFHGVEVGVLRLSTPTETAASRLRRDFLPAILAACEAAGEQVDEVVVELRRHPVEGRRP